MNAKPGSYLFYDYANTLYVGDFAFAYFAKTASNASTYQKKL